jgi:hypothetical protein
MAGSKPVNSKISAPFSKVLTLEFWSKNPAVTEDGFEDGCADIEGIEDGWTDGIEDGSEDGIVDGIEDGLEDGIVDGIEGGLEDGIVDGIKDGSENGIVDGIEDGLEDGIVESIEDGLEDVWVDGRVEGIVLTLELGWTLQEGVEEGESVGEEMVDGLIVFFRLLFFFLRLLRPTAVSWRCVVLPHSTPAFETPASEKSGRKMLSWSWREGN